MKYALVILMLLFYPPTDLFSQSGDSLHYKYTNLTIYRYGSVFQKGNERLGFKDLRSEFSMSDLGLTLYNKAKKYRTTGTILRYVSMIAGFSSIAVAANSGNRNTAYILLGGQIGLVLVSGNFYRMSVQNLDRALWLRNRDVLFPDRQP